MENLDNMHARQNLFQVAREAVIKRIYLLQVEHVAVVLKAQLKECDRLAFDQTFTVETEDRRWVARQNVATDPLHKLRCLNKGVGLER